MQHSDHKHLECVKAKLVKDDTGADDFTHPRSHCHHWQSPYTVAYVCRGSINPVYVLWSTAGRTCLISFCPPSMYMYSHHY